MRGLQEPRGNTRAPDGQIGIYGIVDKLPTPGSDLPNAQQAGTPQYRGRFAPSPSGPLHLGSLIAALASFLQARAGRGQWLVRIEDVDRPRVDPRAAALILETLVRYGLEWDGEVVYQSRRCDAYRNAMDRLLDNGDAFWCGCSRREVRSGPQGIEGPIYPGYCRDGLPAARRPRSVRARVRSGTIRIIEPIHGAVTQDLAADVGDFIIRRADGLFAYQLAVVVDDAAQGITEVVRGADLLTSTPRQVFLQRLLGLPTPAYLHTPLVLMDDGRKLSKQHGAPPLPMDHPGSPLVRALECLGQAPPAELGAAPARTVIDWAIMHWQATRVPRAAQSGSAYSHTPVR